MGIVGILAFAALGVAIASLIMVQNLSGRAQRTAVALQNQQQELTEELSSRLRQIGERFGVDPAEANPNKQLAATLKVLELRMVEHDALLCSLVTEDEARHLWNVSLDKETVYQLHAGVEAELRQLVRRGLLKKQGDFKIHELPAEFDLHDRFSLTDSGEMLLALRKHLKDSDTRVKDSLPPAAPNSETRSAPPPFVRPRAS